MRGHLAGFLIVLSMLSVASADHLGGVADVTVAGAAFLPSGTPAVPTTIRVQNLDPIPHSFTTGLAGADGAIDVALAAGSPLAPTTATVTGLPAGATIPYFCSIHPWMRGVLVTAA